MGTVTFIAAPMTRSDQGDKALRVCIITEANPVSWASLYVEAFRARCEVITVGPLPKAEDLKWWGLDGAPDVVQPNDVTVLTAEIVDLEVLLPVGWDPDLVVTIASSNHAVLRNTNLLRCPSAFISIDTFQNMADFEYARCYDFVFAAQREYADALGAKGSSRASWLPLACSPNRHHAVEVAAEADLAFVGSVRAHVHRHRHRLTLLEALRTSGLIRS